jgi:hypothetical protein
MDSEGMNAKTSLQFKKKKEHGELKVRKQYREKP